MKWELLKNTVSLIPALLPLVEKRFAVLPVNPGLRESVLVISIVIAAIAGVGSYQTTRRSHNGALAWSFIVVALIGLALMLALTGGMNFGMQPHAISLFVRVLYVLIFTSLGIAVGGFVGLT